MAVEKKNATASTKSLTSQTSSIKKQQTIPQTAKKIGPVSLRPEAKQGPKAESPAVKLEVSEASARDTNNIAIIAVPLFGAVWYMVCLIILL